MGQVEFGVADVRAVAGLSYRQLNDWEGRGALPHLRSIDRGWRRFTPAQAFALAVCARIRRRFAIRVEALRWSLRELADKEHALERIAHQGQFHAQVGDAVFMTDLTTFAGLCGVQEAAARVASMTGRDGQPWLIVPVADLALRVERQMDEIFARVEEANG